LSCLNFLVSHSDISIPGDITWGNIKVHITITGQVYCRVYKLFRNFLPEDENIQIFNNILVRVTIR
jgi:hypothetical protein